MKKKAIASTLALLAFTAVSAQTYQLPNVGFENWESAGKSLLTADNSEQQRPGSEPVDWNSSNVKCTALSFSLVQEKTANNSKYAQIVNKKVGSAATKYVPYTGTLSLGNTWYTIWWNWTGTAPDTYAGKKGNQCAQNGSYGGIQFVGRPDALVGDFAITSRSDNENAHVITYLWTGTFTGEVPAELDYTGSGLSSKGEGTIKSWKSIENVDRAIWSTIAPSIVTDKTVRNIDASNGSVIAYCDKAFSNTFDWTNVEIPLTYKSDATPEMANVIVVAGNPWDSRSAVAENNILADNIRYAYYSRLSEANLDGYAISFDPNTYDYVIEVDDAASVVLPAVTYTAMSNDALTADKEVTVKTNDETKQINVVVTNKSSQLSADATDVDGLGSHTYNFYFREAAKRYEGFYYTTVSDSDIFSGEPTEFTLAQQNDDYRNYTLTVNDVKVASTGELVNITVSNLAKTYRNGVEIYVGSDPNAKVGDETKEVSTYATFDGEKFEVAFSFTNADGTVTKVVATPEPATSSVAAINGETASVAAAEGAVRISNYNGDAAVYTTDGRLAATATVNGTAEINLAAGLYIVRTGNAATKVIVK